MGISSSLYRLSMGWITLVGLIIFFLFMLLVLPSQAEQARINSGGNASPDTSFIYSTTDLYQMADAYGEAGRLAYIRARFTFDLIFPLVYGFFLLTSLSWIFERVYPPTSRWRLANLVPLLGILFDYLENLATSVVMFRYPEKTSLVDLAAPAFSLLKWIFVTGSFVLLILALVKGIMQIAQNYARTERGK